MSYDARVGGVLARGCAGGEGPCNSVAGRAEDDQEKAKGAEGHDMAMALARFIGYAQLVAARPWLYRGAMLKWGSVHNVHA